jgi:hypothetical protein
MAECSMPVGRRACRLRGVLLATEQSSPLAYFGASRVARRCEGLVAILTFLRFDRYS